jgi:dTDP-glucose 4,6-dehydratase
MNWNNRKVLVTGGSGFIGSHLVERLQTLGASIRVFVRYTSSGGIGNLALLPEKNFEVYYGDLRNPDAVKNAMKDIDFVFHLASLISIPYSYQNPRDNFDVNINSILNILQAAKELETSLVIHTSTSEVYGTAHYVPIDENHPLQGQSPYSASKIAADKLAESFYLSFNLPIITIRPFNTYGPRQSKRAIIPTIITQLLKGNKVKLGELSSTRDFLFVNDTVAGFITAAEQKEKLLGGIFNLGTGREISIKDLGLLIANIMEKKIEFEPDSKKFRPENSEVYRLCCNYSKFCSITDWKPKYILEMGLKETINYFSDLNGTEGSIEAFV